MTPEQIAWEMAQKIAAEEGAAALRKGGLSKTPHRDYWAKLYAECADVVKQAFPQPGEK